MESFSKILTAAHCMVENMPFHKDIIVTAGTITPDSSNKDKQTRAVEKVLVHDRYELGANHVQAFYDIALIKLVSPFKYSLHLQPVKLGAIDTRQGALIYGFGSTHVTNNSPSDYLLGKIVKLVPDDVCQKMLKNTKTKSVKQEYEICLTNGYCHGDSGSPLIQVQNKVAKVVGVASWVADDIYGCNTPPAVALNVGYFSDWLQKGLKSLK